MRRELVAWSTFISATSIEYLTNASIFTGTPSTFLSRIESTAWCQAARSTGAGPGSEPSGHFSRHYAGHHALLSVQPVLGFVVAGVPHFGSSSTTSLTS